MERECTHPCGHTLRKVVRVDMEAGPLVVLPLRAEGLAGRPWSVMMVGWDDGWVGVAVSSTLT